MTYPALGSVSPPISLFDLRPDLRPTHPGEPVVVAGDLFLSKTSISHLPDHLSVGGSLDLENTPITHLPTGLSVGRHLYLERSHILHVPQGVSVGGYLALRGTRITYLPEGFSTNAYLDLHGSAIAHLPDGLSVGDTLDLGNTSITHLPNRLSVGRHLELRDSRITHLPKDASILGTIYPPESLVDYVHFRATLTERLQLQGPGASAHVTAHITQRLAPYPDVLRVWQSIPPDHQWTIMPLSEPTFNGVIAPSCPLANTSGFRRLDILAQQMHIQ